MQTNVASPARIHEEPKRKIKARCRAWKEKSNGRSFDCATLRFGRDDAKEKRALLPEEDIGRPFGTDGRKGES